MPLYRKNSSNDGRASSARPRLYYDGADLFSFPSGYATMSTVVPFFLLFMKSSEQHRGFRGAIALTLVLLV
jgi:hypothetical protein